MENEQFYAAMSYHTGASACGQPKLHVRYNLGTGRLTEVLNGLLLTISLKPVKMSEIGLDYYPCTS